MFTLRFTTSLYRFYLMLYCAVSRIRFAEASAEVEAIPSANTEDVAEMAAKLMDAHGNSILRYAYSYVHNMEDAEDILQDTLIAFIRKAPVFESDSHAKAWLLTVAGNMAKNKIKYNNSRRHDELNEELVGIKEENLSFMWEAVKSLPDDYREVIHLFYQEDYTTAQIAEVLNRKESTVRSQLKRGREKLKSILKEVYDFG